MEAFLHGFILALGLILPMGVQNLFIFNQGFSQPTYYRSLPAIITASICDTILIVVAVVVLSTVTDFFENTQHLLVIGGFLFLLYMGWNIWRTVSAGASNVPPVSAKKQVLFALSVSLLNPHALLDTIGVIGTNSLLYGNNDKWLFMIATISVSWLYFFFLAFVGKLIGKIDKNNRFSTLLNKFSAITIWVLAFYMVLSL